MQPVFRLQTQKNERERDVARYIRGKFKGFGSKSVKLRGINEIEFCYSRATLRMRLRPVARNDVVGVHRGPLPIRPVRNLHRPGIPNQPVTGNIGIGNWR